MFLEDLWRGLVGSVGEEVGIEVDWGSTVVLDKSELTVGGWSVWGVMIGVVVGVGVMVGDTGLGVARLGGKGVDIDGTATEVGFGRTKSANRSIKKLLS